LLARLSLMTTATTPNMEHLLHPALKNKNKKDAAQPFWNMIPHWKIPGHVTLEIEQVRAAAECIADFRKRNRDVRWRVQLLLSALGVVGFSDRNGLCLPACSGRILYAAEDVYLSCVRAQWLT
jgi:hypothetical protein